jgi:RHS repeat-associated protein
MNYQSGNYFTVTVPTHQTKVAEKENARGRQCRQAVRTRSCGGIPADLTFLLLFWSSKKVEERNMNGRLYDPVIGRFFSPDNFVQMPECTQGYNRYSYALNNPLKYTDPTGEMYSPYYDRNGEFLGLDENGWSGDIYIADRNVFNSLKDKNGNVNSQEIQAYKTTRIYDNNYPTLLPEAESKIMTSILNAMDDVKFSKLYNGQVSVLTGTANNGTITIGYNDPAITNRLLFTDTPSGQLKVTAKLGELKSLGTVESVMSYLGLHEYKGHGILRIPGDENPKAHREAYRLQYNHPTYKYLPAWQQKEIFDRMNGRP